jgi:hypothetical protein
MKKHKIQTFSFFIKYFLLSICIVLGGLFIDKKVILGVKKKPSVAVILLETGPFQVNVFLNLILFFLECLAPFSVLPYIIG